MGERIADTDKVAARRGQAERAPRWDRSWLLTAAVFVMLCALVWLDELLDLPHLLLGGPHTPVNWREAVVEALLVAIIGLLMVWRHIRDIAERKRTEGAVRASEAKYRTLFNSVVDPVFIFDQETLRFLDCNQSAMERYGYTLEELREMTPLQLHPPDELDEVEKNIADEGDGAAHRYTHITKGGERLHVEVRTAGLEYEGRAAWVSVVRDITERVRAEEVLRAEKERAQQYLDIAGVMIIVFDRDGCVTLINKRGLEILGYQEAELIGKDWLQTCLPEGVRGQVGHVFELLLAGDVEPVEYNENPVLTKDGSERLIAWRNAVLRDAAGNISGILSSGRDITERKRAEEALRESEKKFRTFTESAPVAIMIYQAYQCVYANPGAERVTGYTAEELSSMRFWDFMHPDYRDIAIEAGKALERDESPVDTAEFKIVTKNGAEKWLDGRLELIECEGERVALISAMDVTERKRAEEALRESEEKLRHLFESATDGIFAMDLNGAYTEVNQRVLEIHGLSSREEMLGKSGFEFVAPRDVERAMAGIKEVLEQGTVVHQEYGALRADGSEVALEVSGTALRDASGNPVGIIGIARDITERKRAEEALRKYSERLEEMVEERTGELREAQERLIRQEKLAVLGELAGGVGHELRNPLGVIKNAAYFLNMVLEESDPEVKETLGILENEVANCERIIGSLLGFAGARPPTRRKVDVNELIREALSGTAVPEHVEVVRRLDETLPDILADPDQLRQVFENIILNAVQAMPEGGWLEVGTSVVAGESPESGWMMVSLADTGVGIPGQDLGKVFEPLFTTKAKGIGLGLAIVRILVEGHGGSVTVESEAGKGSTFTVRLPLQGVRTKAGEV